MTRIRTTRMHKGLACLLMLLSIVYVSVQGAEQSPIAAAAKANNLTTVRALIAKGTDVNAPQADGSTALLWAAYNGNAEMTKALLASRAKVDVTNKYGVTPLLQAARMGESAVMELLLNAGAKPTQLAADGTTPLMAAARAGSVEGARMLVARGADVNAADAFQEETALMWAAREGHLAVVKTLLEVGGNPNLKSHVTTLTERRAADHPTGGMTALMFAVRDGHGDVAEALIKGGADLKATNGDANGGLMAGTAMHIAIVNDRFDLAARLLELGADANDGSLFLAVDAHDGTTDARARDGSKLRPDHANKLTSMDLIRLLLDKGADPNKMFLGQFHNTSLGAGDFYAGSPFYKAAAQADVEVLKLLIARGANVEWVPPQVTLPAAGRGGNANWGRPALFAAMNGGRGAAFGAGPGFSRQGPPPFREPGTRSPAEAAKALIAAGADPNVWSWPDNSPPIHRAAALGNIDLIKTLVSAGAKLDSWDNDGNTPLQIAERTNTPEAIKRAEDAVIAAVANGTPVPARGAPPQEVVNLIRDLMGLPPEAPKAVAAAEGGAK
ncbi:MAG: ankyrin repeat domain-containing protein [Vicinamibacterales bacterium]